LKKCGDGGAGGSRAGCRGLRPLPGFGAAPQNLCRSTTSQALRAAKGRKKRGSFHPHRFPHPPPPLVSLPSQISAFCALAARSPCICSRLQVALPPSVASAHRAHASFRSTFGSLCAARNSPPGWRFPDCMPLPVLPAQSSRRALAAPTARFAVHLRVALRCAQQPTGLALPSGAPKPVPQHDPASVASGQRPQETRLIPPASFFHQPSGATGASSPPAAHLFAPLRQGFAPCAPKPAIKPYQQRSQSP